MKKIRKLIKSLVQEEIGRNYHTIDNDPYSYEDYPGMNIDVYPMANGAGWYAQVTCDFDEKLSTPLRTFSTDEDANNFARQHAEQINRIRLSRNIDTGTPAISDID